MRLSLFVVFAIFAMFSLVDVMNSGQLFDAIRLMVNTGLAVYWWETRNK